MNRGIWLAIAAYTLWGVFPVYWKLLHSVPAEELLAHRILWSCLSLCGLLWGLKRFTALREALRSPRILGYYVLSSALIGANWWLFIWAVNAGYLVESSLGYFINPLLSVVLGVVFFKERLRRGQWVAVAIASVGVIYLTYVYGTVPWIALGLALTFGFYGLIKKVAPLGSFEGLTLETSLLLLPSLIYITTLELQGQSAFGHAGWGTTCLIMAAGFVTIAPLSLFSSAAQSIPLSLVGICQYIAPTLQLLLGVLIYKEHFPTSKLYGFVLVWVALLVFAGEGLWRYRTQRKYLRGEAPR